MSSDYQVGYRKPPLASRFKRGMSGNPKGRPKRTLNLATDLENELREAITVREGGRSQRVSKQRALLKSLMAKALDGDVRATTAILTLYARVIAEPPEEDHRPFDKDELVVLRRFAPRFLKTLSKKEKH
jgi:hypothetical protein